MKFLVPLWYRLLLKQNKDFSPEGLRLVAGESRVEEMRMEEVITINKSFLESSGERLPLYFSVLRPNG